MQTGIPSVNPICEIFFAVSIEHRQSDDGVLLSLAVVVEVSSRFAQLRTSASNRQGLSKPRATSKDIVSAFCRSTVKCRTHKAPLNKTPK
jgi:hypothetical protein